MKDKRFREVEEKILQLFFEYGYGLTAKMAAMKLGIARSTFYRHHKSVHDIMPDYARTILADVRTECKGCSEECVRSFFRGVLIMIVHQKVIFLIFLKMRNREVLVLILLKNQTMLLKYADFKVEAGKVFNIYIGEVIAIMAQWGESGFNYEEISLVLSDILYLTKTMKRRLGPLL